MTEKTQKAKVDEIHTILLGVSGTDERGIAGDVKDLVKQVTAINGAVRTNTAWRKALVWVIGSVIIAIGVIAGLLANLM